MLQEIGQNISLTTMMIKQKLNIHHANLFTPNVQEIFKLTYNPFTRSLATLKKVNQHGHPITIIEIYRMKYASSPSKLIRTYTEYEELTDLVWLNGDNFMTASKEQNLNFYSVDREIKIAAKITDYGSITSIKYIHQEHILFTGTEYGHLIAYKIHPKGKTVEPLNKMVKVNGKIKALDISKTMRQVPPIPASINPSFSKIIPGKRKRADTDDEEEEEDKNEEKVQSIDMLNITIYGACDNNIIAWNYHKKTIMETMHVCDKTEHVTALLTLQNGDIVAGDSTGSINIFDSKTFTCRQTIKLLESSILCVVKSEKECRILVSGQNPSVFTLRKKATNEDELVLFEKLEVQAHKVSSIAVVNRKEYFTGGDDGMLIKIGLKQGQKELKRVTLPPRYVDKIKCSKGEMMFQYDKSLVVWKLKKNPKEVDTMPTKHLLLKTRDFIQTSTITFDYISYSTKKGLYIVDRKAEKLKSIRQVKWNNGQELSCNILKFCSQGQYLVYATVKILTIVSLIKGTTPKVEIHLKSPIRQIINLKQFPDLVAVVCSKHFYLYQLSTRKLVTKVDLGNDEVSFAAHDKKCANIYIYTFHDQLAKIKIIDKANVALEKTGKPIEGLPDDVNMLGMLCFPNDHCILFEPNRMFKVDLVANKVVNVNTNYKYILKMDFLFNNSEHVSLVELRPDYYTELLPSVVTKKFGNK